MHVFNCTNMYLINDVKSDENCDRKVLKTVQDEMDISILVVFAQG